MKGNTTQQELATVPEFPTSPVKRPTGVLHRCAFVFSFPERGLRYGAALLGSCALSLSRVLPRPLRETRFYKTAVERQIRVLTDDIGQAGVFGNVPAMDARTAGRLGVGSALDNLLLLTLHASPVWVLLAATDVCRGAQAFAEDLGRELESHGVMPKGSRLNSVDDILGGLANLSERVAGSLDMPPISLKDMKETVNHLRTEMESVSVHAASVADLDGLATGLRKLASDADRSLLDTTAAVATGALRTTGNLIVGTAVTTTTTMRFVGRGIGDVLSDYRRSLRQIHRLGFFGSLRRFLRPQTRASRRLFAYPFLTYTEIGLSLGRWRSAPWRL